MQLPNEEKYFPYACGFSPLLCQTPDNLSIFLTVFLNASLGRYQVRAAFS